MSDLFNSPPPRRRYVWPWFVLLALVAAVLLAIMWLSYEIARTRRIRDLNGPQAGTSSISERVELAPIGTSVV